ncbi:MAG: hypothetical protein IJV06_01710 [Bacteroidaceae bacterium]|nr:hypothetical protein [Bacteroidaceae bacterium]
MNANRNKQKTQNRQLHRQLQEAEMIQDEREQKKALLLKISDFLLDLTKLVFAGIILTGIIDLDLNKVWLFTIGLTVTFASTTLGFYMFKRGSQIN